MKLRQLEIRLERLEGFPEPKAALEQYPTPAPLAARLLFEAFQHGDIEGRRVCDPGCGTGVLAIGAALLGAGQVTGIEIDPGAIGIARKNAASNGVEISFFQAGIADSSLPGRIGPFDTVVMNPPFGAQNPHADRPFIDFALRVAPVTYGIFNEGSVSFVSAYTEGKATVEGLSRGLLRIPRTFSFHTREILEIPVEIIRISGCPR